MQQYKATIWKGGSGRWYVNCVDDLAGIAGKWWVPCRILELAPADFIMLLINDYHASGFSYNREHDFLNYSWENYNDANNFKLMLNRVARQKHIMI